MSQCLYPHLKVETATHLSQMIGRLDAEESSREKVTCQLSVVTPIFSSVSDSHTNTVASIINWLLIHMYSARVQLGSSAALG